MENNLKEQIFSSYRDEVFERIQDYRDNGTHADEALRIFKVLFLLSMVFTVGYGIALHYNLTLPYLGEKGAWAFAIFFTAFIEVGKFIIGRWTVRNIFFGIFKQGIPSAFITLCGFIMTVGAFWWSYYNSTQGVAYITSYLAETHVERPVVDIAATTADVDARQSEVGKMAKQGLSIQWKGNVTRSGQRIAERAALANVEQEKQRTILIEKAAREQERLDTHRTTFIDNVAGLLAMLGGKMEWFQVIILLGMIGAEKTLYDRANKKGAYDDLKSNPKMGASFRAHNVPPTPNAEGPAFTKSTLWENKANPIGFNVQNDGNVRSTINGTPGATVGHSVPQFQSAQNYLSSDHTLKHLLTRIKRDVANLTNENGTPRTVCGRMHDAINEAGQAMQSRDFQPSPKVATDFYKYMDRTVFPLLHDNRRPYEYAKQFLRDLYTHVDEHELTEA
jgi:hypothetical protein